MTTVMGKHETGYARVARDLYPTREPWVTQALLEHVDLTGLSVWEPAAGNGDMAEVLKAAGASVYCSDIAQRSYPLDAVHDFTAPFLAAKTAFPRERCFSTPETRFDAIITNPLGGPRNGFAEAFVAAGLRYVAKERGLLALLLPADFDSAARRRTMFAGCPWFAAKIVLTRRIVWFPRTDGVREAPKENHAWFVWQRTALRGGPPRVLYAPDGGSRSGCSGGKGARGAGI